MKFFKALLVFPLISAGLLAQPADKKVYVNPQVGLNISGLTDELPGLSNTGKAGYNAGLELRLGRGVVFFQPGVFYFQNNTEYTVVESNLLPDGKTTYKSDVKVESIKARAQMGIRVFTSDLISLRLNLGPAFSFPVKVNSEEEFVLRRGDYKVATVGANLGAGVDLGVFTFDLNYEFGLSDYVEFDNPKLTTASSRQYGLSLNIGIRL